MSLRVFRVADLATTKTKPGLFPVSRNTIWRWAREQKNGFPKPFKLSASTTVWDASAIEAFIEKQRAGGTA